VVLGDFDMLAREARWRHLLMHAQVEGSVMLKMPCARFDFTTDMTCLYNRKDTPQEVLKELASSVRNTEELQRVADGLYANVRHWTPRFDPRTAVEVREAGGSRSSTPDVGTPDTDVSWGMPQDPRRPTDPRMAGAVAGAHARGGMSNPASAVLANGVPRDPRARPGGAPARSSPLTLGSGLPVHRGPAGSAPGGTELPFGPPERNQSSAQARLCAAQHSRPAPGPGQALSVPLQQQAASGPQFHLAASARRSHPVTSHDNGDRSANQAQPPFRSSTGGHARVPDRDYYRSRAPPAPHPAAMLDAYAPASKRPRTKESSRGSRSPDTHQRCPVVRPADEGRFARAHPGPHRRPDGKTQ
jgi:hypothetical protein